MGEFNLGDHYIYYCAQGSLRRYGVAIKVNKRIRNAVSNLKSNLFEIGCNLKNWQKDLCSFISQIIPYHSNPNLYPEQECWRSWNLMVLWISTRSFRTNTQKCPFHYRWLECKIRKSRNTWSKRQIWCLSTEWSRTKAISQENIPALANTLFQQYKRRLYTWTSPDTVEEAGIKTIPKKKNAQKQNGCLRRPNK